MKNNKNISLEEIISEKQIDDRLQEITQELALKFKGQELVVIGLLKGSFIFIADLVRHFYRHDLSVLIDFMTVSSYGAGTESSGKINLTRDVAMDIKGANVLIVDDILDTGRTMDFTIRHLSELNPASITTCVLLDKPERRIIPLQPDFRGFEIPDEFVVGYGLDYDHRYRELPNLCRLNLG